MAEAILEVVLENLSSLIQNELGLFLGFDHDLKSLSSTLTAVKATLEDAEEKQFTDKAIKDWLQKLKDAAHVLDDILDECSTHALELQYGGVKCGLSDKVQSSCLSSFHPRHVVYRRKLAKKMKEIRERLDEIADERRKFHLTETVTRTRTEVIDWLQTTSIITQPKVYGREEEQDKIIDFLVGDASNVDDLLVYPIIGMGGLGKTTLAQLIFNHERVVDHFEPRIWVCVSEDFSLKRITKAIIESASKNACADLDLEPLQRKLQDLLQRNRYLLVLDDVWDDNQDNWQRLKGVLACGAKGASILVTTRLPKVAAIMGTMPPHGLSMLSGNDCWELFKQRAFAPNEVEHTELVAIGKEIVKKCGGVPLAAIALGGLLRFKREEKEWLYVKESKLWSLSQDENFVMPALRLSYLNLPAKLRQCFAYCSIFPKDERISKKRLIELWIGNGFISSNERLGVEDVGDEVWNELYWGAFFQDVETYEFDKNTYFKMHDLVHDLAQSVMEEVCCITKDNGITSVPERTRHLSIYDRWSLDKGANTIQLNQVKSLKTFITPHVWVGQLSPQLLRCYSLRGLEVNSLTNLSTSIGRLKLLRYLNLSRGEFKTLPESLCRLWNLQILILDNCYYLQKLPNSLKQLKAVRHLSLRECSSLSSFAPGIGKLTSLINLSMYVVGKEKGLLLAELGLLNLKGELHIKQLEKVTSVMGAKEANIESKQLKGLLLSWSRNDESQVQENVEQILEALKPHPQQLQTLGVGGYRGVHFPQWMASPSFKDLNYIILVDCEKCLHLPSLGKLPSLKKLEICNINHVKYLDSECVFMTLRILLLERLPNLVRLSREDGQNMFPCLSVLQITECPKLALPYLPSLSDLNVIGECSQGLLSAIHTFSSLETLFFSDNKELTCFPDGMLSGLTSLKTLIITEYTKLELLSTEITNLNAIQYLEIYSCDSLESLSDQALHGLHSLKELRISQNRMFKLSTGFQYLTCLEQLTIADCPAVEDFPDALQHMTALQSLKLSKLPDLGSLPDWLGNLTSLRELGIAECPKLARLPMSIQSLTGLKSLKIHRCPELEKRCEKETGLDWPIIDHILDISITSHGYGYSASRFCFYVVNPEGFFCALYRQLS